MDIFDKVKGFIVDEFVVDVFLVNFDVRLVEDLGVDLIDVVELIMIVEDVFLIEILDEVL